MEYSIYLKDYLHTEIFLAKNYIVFTINKLHEWLNNQASVSASNSDIERDFFVRTEIIV